MATTGSASHRVPADLWRHIFMYCRKPREPTKFVAQPALYALMQVSMLLHHVAGPMLYEHVSATDLSRFFLGAMPPSFVPSLSNIDSDFGSRILTKNQLARYVSSIQIIPPEYGTTRTMLPQTMHKQDLENITEYNKVIRFLEYLADPIPTLAVSPSDDELSLQDSDIVRSSFFPRMRAVHVGSRLGFHSARSPQWVEIIGRRIGPALAVLWNPDPDVEVVYCDRLYKHSGFTTTSSSNPMPIIRGICPIVKTLHTDPGGLHRWTILWGTRNIVFYDNRYLGDRNVQVSDNEIHLDALERCALAILEAVEGALPDHMRCSLTSRRRFIGPLPERVALRHLARIPNENSATVTRARTALTVYIFIPEASEPEPAWDDVLDGGPSISCSERHTCLNQGRLERVRIGKECG